LSCASWSAMAEWVTLAQRERAAIVGRQGRKLKPDKGGESGGDPG
jgi:hypothetical protein